MKSNKFLKLYKTFYIVFSLLFVFVLVGKWVGAVNSVADGFRVNTNSTVLVDAHGISKNVTVAIGGKNYFIPTKTDAEWTAFRNAVPFLPEFTIQDLASSCTGPDGSTIAHLASKIYYTS